MEKSVETLVQRYAADNHLAVGVTTADSFIDEAEGITAAHSRLTGFVSGGVAQRIHPRLTMPQANSIIVLAMPYPYGAQPLSEGLVGSISMAAAGEDYHRILERHLEQLQQLLLSQEPHAKVMAFVDTGPLAECALGVRAGLGSMGRNGLLHTPAFGSMVFLGYLITSLMLTPTAKRRVSCGECQRCFAACPTGALTADGFDMKKCRSYLTQKKGVLTYEEMAAIGIQIYGCDQCQLCCPHNQSAIGGLAVGGLAVGGLAVHRPPIQHPYLADLLTMDKAIFAENYQATAAGWRGRNALRKNAVIALGNSKNRDALPLLALAMKDSSPVIRQTAARALAILGDRKGLAYLERRLLQEKDKNVREVIVEAIGRMKGVG